MFLFQFIFALDAALLIGLGHPPDYSKLAMVNDTNGIDYIITAVDGEKPERAHLAYEDVVPVVVVKPGRHKFTLQARRDDTVVKEIQADVKADAEYEILEIQGGGLKIIPAKR
jgi:hypothetical protein